MLRYVFSVLRYVFSGCSNDLLAAQREKFRQCYYALVHGASREVHLGWDSHGGPGQGTGTSIHWIHIESDQSSAEGQPSSSSDQQGSVSPEHTAELKRLDAGLPPADLRVHSTTQSVQVTLSPANNQTLSVTLEVCRRCGPPTTPCRTRCLHPVRCLR